MKILLDHGIDGRMRRSPPSRELKSADEMGWAKLKNGNLLAAAPATFDAVLTVDQKIKSEQNLSSLPVSVVVLVALSNRLRDLLPLHPFLEQLFWHWNPGN